MRMVLALSVCHVLRGDGVRGCLLTQGDARRLRRFALTWASMLRPLQRPAVPSMPGDTFAARAAVRRTSHLEGANPSTEGQTQRNSSMEQLRASSMVEVKAIVTRLVCSER